MYALNKQNLMGCVKKGWEIYLAEKECWEIFLAPSTVLHLGQRHSSNWAHEYACFAYKSKFELICLGLGLWIFILDLILLLAHSVLENKYVTLKSRPVSIPVWLQFKNWRLRHLEIGQQTFVLGTSAYLGRPEVGLPASKSRHVSIPVWHKIQKSAPAAPGNRHTLIHSGHFSHVFGLSACGARKSACEPKVGLRVITTYYPLNCTSVWHRPQKGSMSTIFCPKSHFCE